MKNLNFNSIGYFISVFGVALALFWIGLFKFTPTEAEAIKPLVENHFAMGWLYNILSVQSVSILIGIVEIAVAILLVVGLKVKSIAKYAGLASAVIFLSTVSFMFTTPGTWKLVDGFPVTSFFLLKDVVFLGVSLMVFGGGTRQR